MLFPPFLVHRLRLPLAIGVASLLGTCGAGAVSYDWAAPGTGGTWSMGTNWTPNGLPGTGDIANLIDATADRTITYDTGATGTVGTINLTQTSAFNNALDVVRSLTVTNAITLGASAGRVELRLAPTSTTTVTLTAPSVTVNSGGRLVLGTFTSGPNSFGVSQVTGNVALNGTGQLVLTDATAAGASQRVISGTLTANGGSIAIGSNVAAPNESRLSVSGNFSATGTTITGSGNAYLILNGATNTIDSTSTLGTVLISLTSGSNQAVTSGVGLRDVFLRLGTNGTVIKTVAVNATGQNIGALSFASAATGSPPGFSGTLGLKLGSDLTTRTNAALPQMSGVTQTNAAQTFSIDSNGYTLDLSNTASVWTFNRAATAASVTWVLTNGGTAGAGGIKAHGFNLTGTTTSVTVSVGAGAVLEAVGGNSVANNLGGTGTIAATSLFRYSGSAAVATPSTLTSNRTVGQLEVGNGSTASALSLAGSFAAAGAATVKSFGSFDLGTQTFTANAGLAVEAGGTLRGGNASTAGSVVGATSVSGTLAPGTVPAASGTTIGSVAVPGGLPFESGSILALEIVSAASFDQAVADSVTLNGTVNLGLALGASYTHVLNSTFTILNNTGISGIAGTSSLFTWSGPEGGTHPGRGLRCWLKCFPDQLHGRHWEQ